MTLTTYLIDDEYFALDILKDHIGRTPGLQLLGSSADPLVALQVLSDGLRPDIVFADVEMPGLNGIEFARVLGPGPRVVFTTSHRQFGPEAFELGAADYLLKPVTYERFLSCISRIRTDRALESEKEAETFSFFVKADMKGKLIRIFARDIIYISSEQNYVNIHLNGEKIKAYLTMNELLPQLPARQFCRTHRSYIVNLDRVRVLEPGTLRLSNNAAVDVGPTFKEQVMARLGSRLVISHRR